MSEAGVQTGKEKEELEKQTRLLKQIKEAEDLLKFTQEERKTVTNQKKKEIEKKEKKKRNRKKRKSNNTNGRNK